MSAGLLRHTNWLVRCSIGSLTPPAVRSSALVARLRHLQNRKRWTEWLRLVEELVSVHIITFDISSALLKWMCDCAEFLRPWMDTMSLFLAPVITITLWVRNYTHTIMKLVGFVEANRLQRVEDMRKTSSKVKKTVPLLRQETGMINCLRQFRLIHWTWIKGCLLGRNQVNARRCSEHSLSAQE